MADFRTPLPIHRAAFARIAPGLGLPDDAKEELRRVYQAAERSGSPERERRDVSDLLAEHIWIWPWLEQCAHELRCADVWPLDWEQEGIARPLVWQAVPHGARVRLLLKTLGLAVNTERSIASFEELKRDGVFPWSLELINHDSRCQASAWVAAQFGPRIAAGDTSRLPPFFPGDHCSVRPARPDRRRS